MKKFNLLLVIAILASLTSIAVYAAGMEYTQTLVYFNILADRTINVQILGMSAWTKLENTSTANNIEFNTSSTSATWVNATSIGTGAAQQTNTNPIITIQNAGSIIAQINMSFNQTSPAGCTQLGVAYENGTWTGVKTTLDGKQIMNATWAGNVTLSSAMPLGAQWGVWLYANFTTCPQATYARNLTIWADFAS